MTGPPADKAVNAALTGLLSRATCGWDSPPGLYFAYTARRGRVRIGAESVVPDTAWAGRPPAMVLHAAAEIYALHPELAAVVPQSLAGVVFAGRMHSLAARNTPAAVAGLRAVAAAGLVSADPDHAEQRAAWAVMTGGGQYIALAGRDGPTEAQRITRAEGHIPAALAAILAELTGRRP
jgi:hypothetical protein